LAVIAETGHSECCLKEVVGEVMAKYSQ